MAKKDKISVLNVDSPGVSTYDSPKVEPFDEVRIGEEETAKFREVMIEKLEANKHKGGWQKSDMTYLTTRLNEEKAEFDAIFYIALHEFTATGKVSEENAKKLKGEAADVSNFMLFILDNLKVL